MNNECNFESSDQILLQCRDHAPRSCCRIPACCKYDDHPGNQMQEFTTIISGRLIGLLEPSDIPVIYQINGQQFQTMTSYEGYYLFYALACTEVIILAPQIEGYTVSPERIVHRSGCNCILNQDFQYTSIRQPVTISGVVMGLANPADVTITFTENGQQFTTQTDINGTYQFSVPAGTDVTIIPEQILGYVVAPPSYTLLNVQVDELNQNFQYTFIRQPVTISGVVMGLANPADVTITFTENGQQFTTQTDINGAYQFSVPAGTDVTIIPEQILGYVVAPPSYTLLDVQTDELNQNFQYTFIRQPVTISGVVMGLANPADVTITFTENGQQFTTQTDINGAYQFSVPAGTDVTIIPEQILGYVVAPPSYTLLDVQTDELNQNFQYTFIRQPVTISGVLMGLANPADVTITFTENGQQFTTQTDINGAYQFSVPAGTDVTIIPEQILGYVVAPPSYTLLDVQTDALNQNFQYTFIRQPVTISGVVMGLANPADVTITFTENGQQFTTQTDINGAYQFSVPAGSDVIIIPEQILGYVVAPPLYTLLDVQADVINQNFQYTFIRQTVTVSGVVMGLANPANITITYSENGQQFTTQTDINGAYQFDVLAGTNVMITSEPILGYEVEPPSYTLLNIQEGTINQNFQYTIIPQPVIISGAVRGLTNLADITITYTQNGQQFTTQTDINGDYQISVPVGTNVTITPPQILGFEVDPLSYTLLDVQTDIINRNFEYILIPQPVTISGMVFGLSDAVDIMIAYTINGEQFMTQTDINGNYQFSVPAGTDITITPEQILGYMINPPSYTLLDVQTDMLEQNFLYHVIPQPVTISGSILGLPNAAGIAIEYSVNGISEVAFTDNLGSYQFTVPAGSDVLITPPEEPGYQVTPSIISLIEVQSSIGDQNFIYTPETILLLLSGQVTGLEDAEGISIFYTIDGMESEILTDVNGFYAIEVPAGADVSIAAQAQAGFDLTPQTYVFSNVQQNQMDLDFIYMAQISYITLTRAVETLPIYMQAPNSWPLHGSILPDLFMLDRILIQLDLSAISVKWAPGIEDTAFFNAGGGIDITSTYLSGISASVNGYYTVYAKFTNTVESVSVIDITRIRDGSTDRPYLLIDFDTANTLELLLPGIDQFTLYFMQGGSTRLLDHYELYEDITLTGLPWTPIGTYDVEGFSGGLDGNQHTITGLTIIEPEGVGIGFIGMATSGATIVNLSLSTINIEVGGYGAGLVATAQMDNNGMITIDNCHITDGSLSGNEVGGIFGFAFDVVGSIHITNCTANLFMSGIAELSGIAGYIQIKGEGNTVLVEGCASQGVILGGGNLAGIVGFFGIYEGSSGVIQNCVSSMDIVGDFSYFGGIVALAVARGGTITILSCYSSNNLIGVVGLGGICGRASSYQEGTLTIEDCYSNRSITLANNPNPGGTLGGIVGELAGAGITISSCYSTGTVIGVILMPFAAADLFATGGIVGASFPAIDQPFSLLIKRCVALGSLVYGVNEFTGRIIGSPETSQLVNNLALDSMRVLIDTTPKIIDDGLYTPDGLGETASLLLTEAPYQSLGWDFTSVWSFGNEEYTLPVLRGIPRSLQPTVLPPHLEII